MSDLILLAKVLSPWSVRGQVKIEALADWNTLINIRQWRWQKIAPPPLSAKTSLSNRLRSQTWSWSDTPFNPSLPCVTLTAEPKRFRMHNQHFLIHFCEITERTAAEGLQGGLLFADQPLPAPAADEYYYHDLIGARVINLTEVLIGEVESIGNNGVQEILVIRRPDGKNTLIPMVKAYIRAVDVGGKIITVDWQSDWD